MHFGILVSAWDLQEIVLALLRGGASRNARGTFQNRLISVHEAAVVGRFASIANIIANDPATTNVHQACEEGKVGGSVAFIFRNTRIHHSR